MEENQVYEILKRHTIRRLDDTCIKYIKSETGALLMVAKQNSVRITYINAMLGKVIVNIADMKLNQNSSSQPVLIFIFKISIRFSSLEIPMRVMQHQALFSFIKTNQRTQNILLNIVYSLFYVWYIL